jgi:biopolymer transport protein TolR
MKRKVDTDLNLVPFIDLLSTLICFLLITAVWQQISVLSTASSETGGADSAQAEKKIDLSVSLLLDRLEATEGESTQKIPNDISGEPDFTSLSLVLKAWKEKYPDRSDLVIYSDSQAPYKQLIRLMDIAIGARFEDVGVNTN